MNKLFTKVAALTLGVAMAAGVGVALGASHVSEVKAASGDCTMAKGTNAYDDNTINGKFAIKAGASSKQGSMTITIPEAKAKTLSFYACAWNGDATGVDLSSSGVTLSESSLTLTNDSSLSGTGTAWTLANDEETYYFELSLTDCTANAVVTLTAHQASKNRFFVWGASYDDGESGQTVDVTGVELDQEAIELTIPEQQTLVATVSPDDATNKKVTWTSSNPEVASASNGVVKALDTGTTTVTVTTQDGSFTDSCEVTVSLPTITDVTVAEAIEIGSALANGATSSEYYKVTGYVVAITYAYSNGTMSFTMADEKGGSSTVTCYKVACSEQTAASIIVDARVALVGNIQNYYKSNVNTYEVVNNIVSQTSFPGDPTPAPTLESIELSGTYKNSYEIGEQFDPTGLVVTAHYSDETTQVVTDSVQYSGFDSQTAGEKIVTVTYETVANTFTVNVKEPVPVVTEWTESQKEDFADALDELVPPFIDAEFVSKISILVASNFADALVSGDKVNAVLTAFASWGEPYEQDGYYYFEQKTTHGTVTVGVGLSGDDTYFYIMFAEDAPVDEWSSDLKLAFAEQLEGVVPPFLGEEFAGIAWDNDEYEFVISVEGDKTGTIESVFAQTEWSADDNEYYTPTSHGFAVCDYSYDEQKSETKVEIYFYQTKWYEEKEALFAQHLDGFVPNYHWALDYLSWYENIGQFAVIADDDVTSYFVDGFVNAGLEQIVDPQTEEPVDGQYYIYTEHGTVYGITYVDSNFTYAYLFYVADPIPTSLSIDFSGAKTAYYVGDTLDTAGLVVVVLDENGDPMFNGQNVAQYCQFDADLSAAGQVTVSVSIQVTQTITLEGSYQIEVSEAPVPVYTAEDFAHDFLELVSPICSNYDGKKNNKEALRGVWTTMAQRYSTLSNEEKAKVIQAAGKTGGSELERAMAFYDYACKKYGLTKFVSDRTPHALVLETTESNSIVPIIAIIAASIAAVTAIGVIIAYRRRKALISK